MNDRDLVAVAQAMVAEGKGILAIDESTERARSASTPSVSSASRRTAAPTGTCS
jgi:fructose-bisphosphate aldolase class 1